jgi:hypothetical protein
VEFLLEGEELVRTVGVSHYQPAILAAAGEAAGDEIRVDTVATLHPEPDNEHDPNAIAVHLGGEKIGYLARDEAPRWKDVAATLAQHGHVAAAEARIAGRGGGESGTANVGVFLRLPTPTEARAQIGIRLREA